MAKAQADVVVAVLCAPLTPSTMAMPGAMEQTCAECRAPCVCKDTAPEYLPKWCVPCARKYAEAHDYNATFLAPSIVRTIRVYPDAIKLAGQFPWDGGRTDG